MPGKGKRRVVESLKAARVVSLCDATPSVCMAAGNELSLPVERSPTDFAHGRREHASPHQNN